MTNPIVIVTGASSGIGKATALYLAGQGFDVGVGYRTNRVAADEVVASVRAAGQRAVPFALEHREPAAAAAAISRTAEELGGLDAFVNNAAVNRRSNFLDETLDGWTELLTVDLTGPFACAQAAARTMVAQGRGGRIVNVTSVHDAVPIRGGSAYCAAKGGLLQLTRVMALELAGHGISVNAVGPGETATPMNGVPDDVDATEINRPAIPAGRPGRAREVAALVAHLLHPDAAYITGATLTIDGGLTLMSAIPNQEYANVL
ncbi:SDR family oxidoreductase [Paractinoplanes ovalisporus]|uniref:SDR family oxidoreductase n=1 Tax=Paractinoplanes ovalisporus TaxID=2810368 RepID=UPI0027DDD907|nr:SDR family oxidoreductase [Actinoplanes ovalisporus]